MDICIHFLHIYFASALTANGKDNKGSQDTSGGGGQGRCSEDELGMTI